MTLTCLYRAQAQLLSAAFILLPTIAQGRPVVDFEHDQWDMDNAVVVEHLGRSSLAGNALMKNVEFTDGVIEVDIAVSGARSYPGIVFRVQPGQSNYERFYVRPHRAGLYPDALQYVPAVNGVAGWQLYHGEGFTAGAILPRDEWIHLRMEIRGSQARVFLNGADKPALVIHELKHGESKGSIGLMGPRDGTAYFSNFRYEMTDQLEFPDPPETVTPPGTLTDWEISRPFPTNQVDRSAYPHFFSIFHAGWRTVEAEASGLVNVSKYVEQPAREPQCILARTVVRCDRKQDAHLLFGYSDDVTVFLNGKPIFSGISGYKSRDPSFVGVVGLFDMVHLPLEKGLNEIFLMVSDVFGGWGFMCRTDPPLDRPIKQHELLTKVWETPAEFDVPESVLYDPQRDILYVSSFNRVNPANAGKGYISRMTLDGRIEQLRWITGLDGPCGMGIHENQLYVVECTGNLVEIDIDAGKIAQRYPTQNTRFLNDLTIAESGAIYISNTAGAPVDNDVLRFSDGQWETWPGGRELHRVNGLFIHDGKLIVGNTDDGLIKLIDLEDGRLSELACLGAGLLDGIRVDNEGNYLVSHWEGEVYRISPSGEVVEILDTSAAGLNPADFEFVKSKNLLVIPTFLGNRVVAYRLSSAK